MATESEVKAAQEAAAAVLQAADFRIEDGKAWAEPGDLQVQGVDVRAVVTAALEAAARSTRIQPPAPTPRHAR